MQATSLCSVPEHCTLFKCMGPDSCPKLAFSNAAEPVVDRVHCYIPIEGVCVS